MHKQGAIAAMSATLPTRTVEITVEDLIDIGFTQNEIQMLSALRAHYPFIEYAETDSQWRRLLFLKWRYQHGDLKRK
jgi:hypothetical protein